MKLAPSVLLITILASGVGYCDSFDLRQVKGKSIVTSVNHQAPGPCWPASATSAMESNLLMTGKWHVTGLPDSPLLSASHLQWWNGFNQNNNDDAHPAQGNGLDPLVGGDFRMVQAYAARAEGMVHREQGDPDPNELYSAPTRTDPDATLFYVRDMVWLSMEPNLVGIDDIKQAMQRHGALATSLRWDARFYDRRAKTHYQPMDDSQDPNHAVMLVGWDDQRPTRAPLPGAWLCRHNGPPIRGDEGHFWISYYDKNCARHPDLGAVSFRHVEPLIYERIYLHDYHGWRDTKTDCQTAFNAFTAQANEIISAVSFVTAEHEVDYVVKIFDDFEDGQLLHELSSQTGHIKHRGFHTINLTWPVDLTAGEDFYVYLDLSHGGQAYDRTSKVPILLGDGTWSHGSESVGAEESYVVVSASQPGQSYLRQGDAWQDLYDLDNTANFCIKALVLSADNLILDAVSRVSHGQYRAYQGDIENMGLGLYAGPDYNQGVRNRDGWAYGGTLGNEETRLYLEDHFTALGLEVSVQGRYANVVAEQAGRYRPEDIYIVCGHYDTTSAEERPGGDDNASGTAGVIEAARVLTQYDFDATLRFIGFNAEEEWMKGSQDYLDRVVVPRQENVMGVINLDMILRPAWDRNALEPADLDIATDATAKCRIWARIFVDAVHNYVPALLVDPRVPHTANWNAGDQAPFISAGYAAIMVMENTAQEVWSRQSNVYYHTAEDASDALANDISSPSGVTYDYHFATDVVRATVATLAEEAGLHPRIAR